MERRRGAHRARWLGSVDESYALMEQCIDAARLSVRLETYILRETGPGAKLHAALLRACGRGVAVSLLVDAFGSEDLREGFLDSLRKAGAQVSRFNPHRWLRRSLRNHRKLLACDGTQAIIGGFNIGPEYAGDGVRVGWCDTGVWVAGPVVHDLERSFDQMFSLAPFTPSLLRRFRRAHRGVSSKARSREVCLLTGGPALSGRGLRGVLQHDLASAQQIRIASGYFLPSRRIRRQLYLAVRRAGMVQILLTGRSDVPMARLAVQAMYDQLLRRGLQIHEYGPQMLHAKLVIMDDLVHVGSCNLDQRSLYINYELQLRFDWPELAEDARAWFNQAMVHAAQVDAGSWKKGRSWWRRLSSWLAWLLLARIDPLIARRAFRGLS